VEFALDVNLGPSHILELELMEGYFANTVLKRPITTGPVEFALDVNLGPSHILELELMEGYFANTVLKLSI